MIVWSFSNSEQLVLFIYDFYYVQKWLMSNFFQMYLGVLSWKMSFMIKSVIFWED